MLGGRIPIVVAPIGKVNRSLRQFFVGRVVETGHVHRIEFAAKPR